jgi:sigma54-dependent transcription regulator
MLLVIGARGRVQPILACNVHISLAGKHPGDEMGEAASSVFLLAERDMAALVPRKVVPSTEYSVHHAVWDPCTAYSGMYLCTTRYACQEEERRLLLRTTTGIRM